MRPTPLARLVAPLLRAGCLGPPAARAVEIPVAPPAEASPGHPVPIQVFPLTRVVPKGKARGIASFAYLYPDCTSQGPVVARILELPRHGTLTFAPLDSFSRYDAGSPLASCNAKKVPGLQTTYETEDGFEGVDTARILTINPDGIAAEYVLKIWVR